MQDACRDVVNQYGKSHSCRAKVSEMSMAYELHAIQRVKTQGSCRQVCVKFKDFSRTSKKTFLMFFKD